MRGTGCVREIRPWTEALGEPDGLLDHREEIRTLLTRYHGAVGRHPQLALAIFATPEAFAGVTRQITARLTALLTEITTEPTLWRDILVDHAHGSALALASARGEQMLAQTMQESYRQAIDRLLDRLLLPDGKNRHGTFAVGMEVGDAPSRDSRSFNVA